MQAFFVWMDSEPVGPADMLVFAVIVCIGFWLLQHFSGRRDRRRQVDRRYQAFMAYLDAVSCMTRCLEELGAQHPTTQTALKATVRMCERWQSAAPRPEMYTPLDARRAIELLEPASQLLH